MEMFVCIFVCISEPIVGSVSDTAEFFQKVFLDGPAPAAAEPAEPFDEDGECIFMKLPYWSYGTLSRLVEENGYLPGRGCIQAPSLISTAFGPHQHADLLSELVSCMYWY